MKLKTILITSVFILGFYFSHSQEIDKLDSLVSQSLDKRYMELINQYNVVGTSIAIVDDGHIVYAKGFGYADRENNLKANAHTIYRLASITKSFTSDAILKLHHEGKLSYNASLEKYISEFSVLNRFEFKNPVLIRDMMTHTSGLPGDLMNGFFTTEPPDMNWLIGQVQKNYLMAPRQYGMFYSNVAYGLLGDLISRVSGLSYEQYLKKNFFYPLNMKNTFVEEKRDLTLSRGYINGNLVEEPPLRDQGAGLLHSNVIDMGQYIKLLLNQGVVDDTVIIPPHLIKQKETNHLQGVFLPTQFRYGYGVFINHFRYKTQEGDTKMVRYIGHGGNTFAFHADFGYIPELNVGAVVLTNTDTGMQMNDAEDLLQLYLKEKRDIQLNTKDVNTEGDLKKLEVLKGDEIIGDYHAVFGKLRVDRTDKIKFRQGPIRIVLKDKNKPGIYDPKMLLFGIIPFRLNDQEFSFVRLKDEVYLKVEKTDKGVQEFIGVKTNPVDIPRTWKDAVGEYKITGKVYPVPQSFDFNMKNLKVDLYIEDRYLVFDLKGVNRINEKWYIIPLNKKEAVSETFARNTGATFRILDNGNLYFHGFEFKRIGQE